MSSLIEAIESIELLVGFWRYLASPRYRRQKDREWREEAVDLRGRVLVAGEILAGTLVGLGVPVLIVLFLLWNFGPGGGNGG